jgi:hypothetical protein
LNRDWQAQPELMRERDAKFFAGARHNRWPGLAEFTCGAIVRGKRCNRITIIETQHKHCHPARRPRRSPGLSRELPPAVRERATRPPVVRGRRPDADRIRDRQRRKRGGWMLPGLTLRSRPRSRRGSG